jgi:hypothetical protein
MRCMPGAPSPLSPVSRSKSNHVHAVSTHGLGSSLTSHPPPSSHAAGGCVLGLVFVLDPGGSGYPVLGVPDRAGRGKSPGPATVRRLLTPSGIARQSASASHEGRDDVASVTVQIVPGPVVAGGGPRIGVASGDLDVVAGAPQRPERPL